MTADIRTAAEREEETYLEARREAERYAPEQPEAQSDFICGYQTAVRARVTPTRESIAALIEQNSVVPRSDAEQCADAILALIAGLAEGETG